MAHAMAMETPRVRADVIEAQEFPHLAGTYSVRSVPKTVINGVVEVVGAVPEEVLLQRVLVAVGREELLPASQPGAQVGVPQGPSTALSN